MDAASQTSGRRLISTSTVHPFSVCLPLGATSKPCIGILVLECIGMLPTSWGNFDGLAACCSFDNLARTPGLLPVEQLACSTVLLVCVCRGQAPPLCPVEDSLSTVRSMSSLDRCRTVATPPSKAAVPQLLPQW